LFPTAPIFSYLPYSSVLLNLQLRWRPAGSCTGILPRASALLTTGY